MDYNEASGLLIDAVTGAVVYDLRPPVPEPTPEEILAEQRAAMAVET